MSGEASDLPGVGSFAGIMPTSAASCLFYVLDVRAPGISQGCDIVYERVQGEYRKHPCS